MASFRSSDRLHEPTPEEVREAIGFLMCARENAGAELWRAAKTLSLMRSEAVLRVFEAERTTRAAFRSMLDQVARASQDAHAVVSQALRHASEIQRGFEAFQRQMLGTMPSVLPQIRNALEAVESIPVQSAETAFASLSKRDRRGLERFFRFLECEPTPENLYAFWRVVSRSGRWRQIGGFRSLIYLRAAVQREGRLLRRRWRREGTLTTKQRKAETRAASEMERSRDPGPDGVLAMKEADAFRARLRAALWARVLKEGSQRDRRILPLLARGDSPTEIARELGLRPQAVQSFERKLTRWGKEVVRSLQNPVAKARGSAA